MTDRFNPFTLGRALRARREELGLSLREAAGQMGVSYPTLSRLEHGTQDAMFLKALAWLYPDADAYDQGYDDGRREARAHLLNMLNRNGADV